MANELVGKRDTIVGIRQRSNCERFTTLHVLAITWQNLDAPVRIQLLPLKDTDSPLLI